MYFLCFIMEHNAVKCIDIKMQCNIIQCSDIFVANRPWFVALTAATANKLLKSTRKLALECLEDKSNKIVDFWFAGDNCHYSKQSSEIYKETCIIRVFVFVKER